VSQKESTQENVQITLKASALFMQRFDEQSAKLGYTRTEAIRESMRRFSYWMDNKIKQRPEEAVVTAFGIIQAVMAPIIQMMKVAEAETGKIPKLVEPLQLPSKSQDEKSG